MKSIKRFALFAVLSLSVTASYAGCLSQYAQKFEYCENSTGGFTQIGCELDATTAYYSCIYHSATS